MMKAYTCPLFAMGMLLALLYTTPSVAYASDDAAKKVTHSTHFNGSMRHILQSSTPACEAYSRAATVPVLLCPSPYLHSAGLCYPRCDVGYDAFASLCLPRDGCSVEKACQAYARLGVGVPSSCPAGSSPFGALCYKDCSTGYTANGLFCKANPGCTTQAPCQPYARLGQVPSACPAGQEQQGLLCYPACRAGYSGIGAVCFPSAGCSGCSMYARGVGTVPRSCANGFDMIAGLCYPACQAGYSSQGPICTPNSGCTKPEPCSAQYVRTPSSTLTCAQGTELITGLCYQACKSGYKAAGTTCQAESGCMSSEPCKTYGRAAIGVASPGCAAGTVPFAGLCYTECLPGFAQQTLLSCVPQPGCSMTCPMGKHMSTNGQCVDCPSGACVVDLDSGRVILDRTLNQQVSKADHPDVWYSKCTPPPNVLCKRARDEITRIASSRWDRNSRYRAFTDFVAQWDQNSVAPDSNARSELMTNRPSRGQQQPALELRLDRQSGTLTGADGVRYNLYAIQGGSFTYASVRVPVNVNVGARAIRNAFIESQQQGRTITIDATTRSIMPSAVALAVMGMAYFS